MGDAILAASGNAIEAAQLALSLSRSNATYEAQSTEHHATLRPCSDAKLAARDEVHLSHNADP